MCFLFPRFISSSGKLTSLQDYVSRMKDKQETIFYMAGSTKEEVEQSPFVERLLKKGYEVLYLTEAVDEYAISALPEFEGERIPAGRISGIRAILCLQWEGWGGGWASNRYRGTYLLL